MKRITGQFTRYTVILLIVGAILVLIGGLSVGRKAISNQREIALDMTAKTRVDVISKENAELKSENAQLKKDIELAASEKNTADKKTKTLEAFIRLKAYAEEENYEKAREQLTLINQELIPDEFLAEFERLEKEINNN